MSQTIHGVPESITRADYVRLFKSVGIDPRNTVDLSFNAEGVYATVFALNEDGSRYLDSMRGEYVKNEIHVPVVDEDNKEA